MARVIWSPTARRRLDEIVEYVARDSPAAAVGVHRTLLRAVRRIGDWPLSAPWVGAKYPELSGLDQSYRTLTVRPYLVFYRVQSDGVFVLTIQHGAQLPPPAEGLAGNERLGGSVR
jgi:plasmid stabilization system protein ParE